MKLRYLAAIACMGLLTFGCSKSNFQSVSKLSPRYALLNGSSDSSIYPLLVVDENGDGEPDLIAEDDRLSPGDKPKVLFMKRDYSPLSPAYRDSISLYSKPREMSQGLLARCTLLLDLEQGLAGQVKDNNNSH
jgi:hypothetical protein